MNVIKPPTACAHLITPDCLSLFLAGSIEQGEATDWQSYVEKKLEDIEGLLLNPRRDNWDRSLEQSIYNPVFREQVLWELHCLEKAKHIFMYFDPATKSPITLEELGICSERTRWTKRNNLTIVCPKGFWRRGNIEVTCYEYGLSLLEDIDEGIEEIRRILLN